MKQVILLTTLFTVLVTGATAQKYYTKNGSISFFSKTSMENIKADNNQVLSVLNAQTGEIQFSVLIKSFHFEKALMEEHFNENYLESGKFPKATFKGTITDMSRVNFNTDGMYTVPVSGDLTIHGVTKKITTTGTITIKGGNVSALSKFFIKLSDYNISIPSVVKDNIAESVEVTVNSSFDQKM
ncbi:MAG TPA: YceI family protein [Ferruginibacter sp.]|nr:YceI family protein [Ferruginibacter sp.]HNN69967.1 YceI family protein [Ferruginibacter sp.]